MTSMWVALIFLIRIINSDCKQPREQYATVESGLQKAVNINSILHNDTSKFTVTLNPSGNKSFALRKRGNRKYYDSKLQLDNDHCKENVGVSTTPITSRSQLRQHKKFTTKPYGVNMMKEHTETNNNKENTTFKPMNIPSRNVTKRIHRVVKKKHLPIAFPPPKTLNAQRKYKIKDLLLNQTYLTNNIIPMEVFHKRQNYTIVDYNKSLLINGGRKKASTKISIGKIFKTPEKSRNKRSVNVIEEEQVATTSGTKYTAKDWPMSPEFTYKNIHS